jgi:alanyl-tRNA synthetase
MTRKLYETAVDQATFRAEVLRREGDWVALDQTAFFPGGGGQDADAGTIDGLKVTELKGKGEVLHRVPGNSFAVGQSVEGRVDIARRRELMRAHTGEHLLYSSLEREVEGLELVKIAITPGKKSFIVKGRLGWEEVLRAEERANRAIGEGAEVSCHHARKGDPVLEEARVKLDRIPGEEVRLIRIGGYDLAACAGLHVANASEIGMLLVTRLTSAKPSGDWEVEFEVGEKAVSKALALSALALRACERVGSQPSDLLVAIDNRWREAERAQAALNGYGRRELRGLQPVEMMGVRVFSAAFGGIDRKEMMEAASALAGQDAVAVLACEGEKTTLVVACGPGTALDSRSILNEALAEFGGRGGGKKEFASGGAPSGVDAALLARTAVESLARFLGLR